MAIDYFLDIHDNKHNLTPTGVRANLISNFPLETNPLSDILSGPGVSVSVFHEDEDASRRRGFTEPRTCVAFRINKFEMNEVGMDQMFRMVHFLIHDLDGEAVLSFDLMYTVLRKMHGELILVDDPDEWTPARKAIFADCRPQMRPRPIADDD